MFGNFTPVYSRRAHSRAPGTLTYGSEYLRVALAARVSARSCWGEMTWPQQLRSSFYRRLPAPFLVGSTRTYLNPRSGVGGIGSP